MAKHRSDINTLDVERMYYEEGMNQQEIADYYGCDASTISNRLHPEMLKARNIKRHLNHRENINECSRKYCSEHREEEKERVKKWRNDNPEKWKETKRKWRADHPDYMKDYYEENKESILEQVKEYQQTDKGKAVAISKTYRRRRDLGFIPLNKHFEDGEWHHYDKEHVICIPKEIHQSIYHVLKTGQCMEEINKEAFEFLDYELREEAWSKITGDWRDYEKSNDTYTKETSEQNLQKGSSAI